MKKIWTFIASTMLVASAAFAQDDYDYADQADEQYTEQEQAEVQADEQQQAEASSEEDNQASVAEEAAPSKPVAAPINNQASTQEPVQENVENDYVQEPAPRQTNRFGFGLRVAFDYGRMFGFKDDMDNDSDISGNPSGIGFEAGLMVRFQMIPNLFFAPEVNVAYISTNHEYMKSERKYNSVDLEIPLLMRGIIADRFYITGGPQVVFSMSSKAEIEPLKNTSLNITAESEEKIDQASFGFGIAAGAGINIVEGLFIDLRYYMGLTELYPDVKSMEDFEEGDVADGDFYMINMSGARMMKFKVGISYWFM